MEPFNSALVTAVQLLFLTVCVSPPGRCQAQSRKSAVPNPKFGIEVTVPGGKDFYISVFDDGGMIGVVPMSKDHSAGIRIIPRFTKGSLSIKVFNLLPVRGKLSSGATCKEIQEWPSQPAGSYAAELGETVILRDITKLGLPEFKLKVVPARTPPTGAPDSGFCACGEISSFPYAGKCMEPGGGCGFCCMAAAP